MATTSLFHPSRRSVWLRCPGAENAEDPTLAVRPTPGPAAACLRALRVALVSVDLIESHLEEQDVTDDAVSSMLRHHLHRESFHFVVAGPPSSTFAPLFRDPQHVHGIVKSSARKPSQVERTPHGPPCWRSEPQRRAASCVHGRGALSAVSGGFRVLV